ncbi:N-acetylneuraminate synthase (plasmid) [Maritalea myrionectae]|uniref:N-acetylneuraminate synthase n=1 Tax=Maritalea myrionectae TaxID=454601 RepID=A0A2R4MJV1_9HYPH|nr:N-acetylneuraminate synthase family protein [Maritalea myrionectae]AVX06244.1 N-acetylneuraminate synthase [Maritalea myrionectae]
MRWNSSIRIAGTTIDSCSPSYFIADIAANHDGDFERAKALVHLAKEAGADCAKFQHFLPNKIVSQKGFDSLKTNMAHQAAWEKSVVDVYDQYHFRRDWTAPLKEECDKIGIDFMTTPYDFEALEEVAPLVPAFKIGSGDVTWHKFIEQVAKQGKPVLIATGAADMEDSVQAVETVLRHNPNIVLFQCNTNYTGSLKNFRYVNLNVLRAFALRYPGMVLGLSDHTPGHSAVLGAVTLGARVIEKHFTDDNSRIGPDHSFALNPVTWREMVHATRELELALGDGVKRFEDNESETVIVQRRSIRVKGDLPVGHILDADDLECLRPCPADAIDPRHWDTVLGKSLTNAKQAGEYLSWPDVE